MILYWTRWPEPKIHSLEWFSCPNCGDNKSLNTGIQHRYFHVYFIPTFYSWTITPIVCENCWKEIKKKQLSQNLKDHIDWLSNSTPIPNYYYIWTYILSLILGWFYYIYFFPAVIASVFLLFLVGANLLCWIWVMYFSLKNLSSIQSKNLSKIWINYSIRYQKYKSYKVNQEAEMIIKSLYILLLSSVPFLYILVSLKELFALIKFKKWNAWNDFFNSLSKENYEENEIKKIEAMYKKDIPKENIDFSIDTNKNLTKNNLEDNLNNKVSLKGKLAILFLIIFFWLWFYWNYEEEKDTELLDTYIEEILSWEIEENPVENLKIEENIQVAEFMNWYMWVVNKIGFIDTKLAFAKFPPANFDSKDNLQNQITYINDLWKELDLLKTEVDYVINDLFKSIYWHDYNFALKIHPSDQEEIKRMFDELKTFYKEINLSITETTTKYNFYLENFDKITYDTENSEVILNEELQAELEEKLNQNT